MWGGAYLVCCMLRVVYSVPAKNVVEKAEAESEANIEAESESEVKAEAWKQTQKQI